MLKDNCQMDFSIVNRQIQDFENLILKEPPEPQRGVLLQNWLTVGKSFQHYYIGL